MLKPPKVDPNPKKMKRKERVLRSKRTARSPTGYQWKKIKPSLFIRDPKVDIPKRKGRQPSKDAPKVDAKDPKVKDMSKKVKAPEDGAKKKKTKN